MKRILDGEIEQRKHHSRFCLSFCHALRTLFFRQLREVEARMEHIQQSAPAGEIPARLIETHRTLVTRKAELDNKVFHHSNQIAELQKMYEQAKLQEERTGASNETKRWNGIRTVNEARSLLKILFKIASDHKVQANEYYNENAQLAEESAELQEKLEIMAQEINALRSNLVRAEAAAIAAVALSSQFGAVRQTDDNVLQFWALLETRCVLE